MGTRRRLRHSVEAAEKALKMTRARLQVFIEGKMPDIYVYDKVLSLVCSSSWDYILITPKELPRAFAGEGKTALRDWYRYLRRNKLLIVDGPARRSVVAFIFDKDIDDLQRTRCRSDHVIYTEHYDIEGHIFEAGDLVDALAAAMSISAEQARTLLGRPDEWCTQAAVLWQEWVVICAAAKMFDADKFAGYRSYSRVNTPYSSPADPGLLAAELADLQKKSGLSDREFTQRLDRVRRVVAQRYRENRFATVFKGKWYGPILGDYVQQGKLKAPIKGSFADRFLLHLAQSAKADNPTFDFVAKPCKRLLHIPAQRSSSTTHTSS